MFTIRMRPAGSWLSPAIRRMCVSADALLEGFRPGVMERLGLGPEDCARANPRLVYGRMTGWGQDGPMASRAGHDINYVALSGVLGMLGRSGERPAPPLNVIGDMGGGLMGVIGVLSALLAREQTGRGQHVDISMLDTQISLLNYMVTMHALSGNIPERMGNGHMVHVPYDVFQCADGYIVIAIIMDEFWGRLLQVIPAGDLDTEENQFQPGRLKNKGLINRRLNEILSTNTQKYWLERLQSARIPCAPVNNLRQSLTDEQVLFRNMVVDVEHPLGGSTKIPGNPIKLSDTYEDTFNPPPLLGQHNEEVFTTLGMTREDLDALQNAGVI